jgi:hypothetical protein
MDEVLATGLVADEVLQFLTFREGREIGRVSRAWRQAVKASMAWALADVGGFGADALSVLNSLPDRTLGLRVDVRPGGALEVLAAALQLNLARIEIYSRTSDGAVFLPEPSLQVKIARLPFSGLHVVIQEPVRSGILRLLIKYGSKLKTVIFLRGMIDVDETDVAWFLESLTAIEELRLGSFPSCIDFDPLVDNVLGLKATLQRFQAEALNISLTDLSRLNKSLPSCEVAGVHVLALFAGLI